MSHNFEWHLGEGRGWQGVARIFFYGTDRNVEDFFYCTVEEVVCVCVCVLLLFFVVVVFLVLMRKVGHRSTVILKYWKQPVTLRPFFFVQSMYCILCIHL